MLVFLKKLKSTSIYYFFLKYIFIPIYSFFWHYILHFYSKIISKIYLLKNNKSDFIKLKNNSKILVHEDDRLKLLAERISRIINPQLLDNLKKKISSEEYKKEIFEKTNNETVLKNIFSIDIFNEIEDELKKDIIEFATSEMMLKTVTSYLGVFPLIRGIYLNVNFPSQNRQTSSQLWHRDDFGYKTLDFFMAINEIDDNNGPLITLKKKDPLKIFYRIKNEVDTKLKGERGKISDNNFNYLSNNDEDSFLELKGKKGTALFIDSFRNYHKGGFCKKNNRIVLRISYMTNDCTFDLDSNYDEKQKWYSLLQKKKQSSFFIKKIFQKRNRIYSFCNIPNLLFKFYHIVSIKK